MSAIDATDDPDGMDVAALALVSEAAGLLRSLTTPRDAAVDKVVRRVRKEAYMTAVASTIGGSIGRLAKATPDLLGLNDPLDDPGDPHERR